MMEVEPADSQNQPRRQALLLRRRIVNASVEGVSVPNACALEAAPVQKSWYIQQDIGTLCRSLGRFAALPDAHFEDCL